MKLCLLFPVACSVLVTSAAFAQSAPQLAPPPPPPPSTGAATAAPPPLPPPSPSPAPAPAPAAQAGQPAPVVTPAQPNVTVVQTPAPVVTQAQGPQPYPAPEADPDAPPPARTGFQIALRTGYSVPFGHVAGDRTMSDMFTGQVPLFVELGAKVHRNVFVGVYTALSFGGAGDAFDKVCSGGDKCVGVGFRIGVEAQYHFRPAEKVNPWAGYGLGLESAAVGRSGGGNDQTTAVGGIEFARFSGGVDFRLSRVVAIGPALDVSLGRYTATSTDINGVKTDDTIPSNERRTHGWMTLGVRLTFLP
jgi:hypothetical protein